MAGQHLPEHHAKEKMSVDTRPRFDDRPLKPKRR
jgi:hypothetical protein